MASSADLPHIAYFHGQPGGPGEWQACAPPGLRAFAPDRTMPVDTATLAGLVVTHCADGPVTLIGFSLGAPVALAVARALGDRVAHLHLISPAAPLALGDFLPAMAGGGLFRLARARPALFRLVAQLESLIARTAPGFLCDRLFATAAGADLALSRDPGFRQAMAQVLRAGLGRTPAGFIAEVTAYAANGPADLAGPAVPITLWQGDADNWTPPAMAEALAAALPAPVTLNRLPGCSHYSALRAALARL
jgi:pimeloyl-ACP methyl ester carboxylesterase